VTSLGTGAALVSVLDEKGRPTPLAATMLRAPISRMDILTPQEISGIISGSELAPKYNKDVDRESAHEILGKKMERAEKEEAMEKARQERETIEKSSRRSRSRSGGGTQGAVLKVLTSASFIRGVMSILNKALK